MPLLGSIVQKGKLAAWALAFSTSALNRVDFPTFGNPIIPVLLTFEKTYGKIIKKTSSSNIVFT